MADNQTDSPETIERDIEQTQDRIGETVEKIEEKLTPTALTRSVLGDDGADMVREGLRLARENPIPLAMIVIGAVWLFATSDSPLIRRVTSRMTGMIGGDDDLRSRSDEPAPIGPPPAQGEAFDRRR